MTSGVVSAEVTGDIRCWGANSSGQLGNLTKISRLAPTTIAALSDDVMGLELGGTFSCVLTVAGAAKCWGDNTFGQIGNLTRSQRATPVTTRNLLSLVRARAQFTTSFSEAGVHSLHVNYGGDATHAPSMGVATQFIPR